MIKSFAQRSRLFRFLRRRRRGKTHPRTTVLRSRSFRPTARGTAMSPDGSACRISRRSPTRPTSGFVGRPTSRAAALPPDRCERAVVRRQSSIEAEKARRERSACADPRRRPNTAGQTGPLHPRGRSTATFTSSPSPMEKFPGSPRRRRTKSTRRFPEGKFRLLRA